MAWSNRCGCDEPMNVKESEPIPTKRIKLRPIGDRVLVKVLEQGEVSKNGIYLPDVAVEKPLEGEVVALGSGKIVKGERIPIDLKVGDQILFGKYSGNSVEINGSQYLLLQTDEIQGVFED